MNAEEVESLLERSRPAPPPPELRRRLLDAVDRTVPRVPVSSRKPRWMEVMTVAASMLMLIATVSWLLRSVPPAQVPAAQEGGQPFENRRLSDSLPAELLSEFTWSADGKHWAYVFPTGVGTVVAVVDGQRGQEYPRITGLRFGADGRYAYTALGDAGLVLVVDGVVQKEYQSYPSFAWSPDGKKLALVGVREDQYFVVEDGRKSAPYAEVHELLWSPDGSILAYAARIDNDWFSVVNGKRGEPFDSVGYLRFAPDGKTLSYAAGEGDALIVVGTAKGSDYPQVGIPVFSGDGSTVGYSASGPNGAFLVVGRRSGGSATTEAYVEIGTPVGNRDGRVWACRARLKSEKEIVLVVKRQTRRYLVDKEVVQREMDMLMEEPGAAADSVSDPILNADGTLVAYAAGKGSRKYLVIGEKRTQKFSTIDHLSFGPDGKTVAFRAGQYGKQLVGVGEIRSEEFDEVVSGPVWSKDGTKVAFTARNGAELWSRVLEVK